MNNKNIYDYFLEHYKDLDFINYLNEGYKNRAIFPEVEKEYSKLGEHPSIYEIKFFDTVDNNQINKLIRKIYGLPKKEYNPRTHFNKPSRFKKKSYITIKYDMSSYGGISDIDIIDNPFLKRVEILYASLDSWRYFLEYRFIFKKDINENYDDFIKYELIKGYKYDHHINFAISKELEKKLFLDENFL